MLEERPPNYSWSVRKLMFLGVCGCALGCGTSLVPSPFGDEPSSADAGADAAPMRVERAPAVLGAAPGEVLGGPCSDDAQCDDGVDCTFGACDRTLGRCRFTADDARCADDIYCNGVERCHPALGCQPGPPISCSDSTPCTIDRCDEVTRSCVRTGRDVDGDGDIDGNCSGGNDCDDLDPLVSSNNPELCINGRDDDCDGVVDEAECVLPEHDTCADALEVSAPGNYVLSPAGASLDYPAACAPESGVARELVLAVMVPADRDVEIVARSALAALSLARVGECGDEASELECVAGTRLPGTSAARLRLPASNAGTHVVYALTDSNAPIQLDVSHEAPALEADNRECSARAELIPGEPVQVDLAFTAPPVESACAIERGDRFYEFSLTEPADVLVFTRGDAALGQPRLSLRSASCDGADAELACVGPGATPLQVRALPAGTYVLAASATGPARYELALELRPPSAAPPGDQCGGAPPIEQGQTETLSFEQHVDDIAAGCSPGRLDAARRLLLDAVSDVLVIARFSSIDFGSVALAGAACEVEETRSCEQASTGLARVSARALAAGEHAVVIESELGLPATLTAAVRPAQPPILVPSSDDCQSPLLIGPGGGFFQGNTSNAADDFTASCDFATANGAPDQLLRLVLDEPRRVILDMRGSDFETLLNVRRGTACPGDEVVAGCVVRGSDRSFLDLQLPAGQYFVQIDGYAGASGSWFLDVFTLPP